MKLIFKRLEMHSFMSFEDEIFDFDSHHGMNLIRGKNNDIPNETNGCGKTSLFSALTYSLFGEVLHKLEHNKSIVNKHVIDKDMRVSLSFLADGQPYRVIRGLNKGKTAYLELYLDDENITKSTIAETQKFIENEVIKCDMSIFLRTVILLGKQSYSFYELPKQAKKDFVEKLFDITVFGDMYTAIHKDILSYDKNILVKNNRLLILNKNNEDYKTHIENYENDKIKRIDDIKTSLLNYQTDYKKIKETESDINSSEIDLLENNILKLNESKCKINKSITEINEKNNKINLAIHKIQTTIDTNNKNISKHEGVLQKLCNDCKQVFKSYYKLDQYEKENNELLDKSNKLKTVYNVNTKKLLDLNNETKLFESNINDSEIQIHNLLNKQNKINKELIQLENKISVCNQNLDKIKEEKNPYTELYNTNNEQIITETNDLNKLTEDRRYLKLAENIVSQETIRKFIISDLINLLNNKIKTYLTKLGSTYSIIFDAEMDYKCFSYDVPYEFGNFSDGEIMRISIATSFAFRDFMSIRNGFTSNILILDEYFDSKISSACVDRMVNLLKEYSLKFNQDIYCVSHRPEVLPENFNHIIEIQKTNKISSINFK